MHEKFYFASWDYSRNTPNINKIIHFNISMIITKVKYALYISTIDRTERGYFNITYIIVIIDL